jgi:hypothetical protein
MSDTTLIELSRREQRSSPLGALARRLVLRQLTGIRIGRLRVREGSETWTFGAPGTGPSATITVLDRRFTPTSLSAGRSAPESRTCSATGGPTT